MLVNWFVAIPMLFSAMAQTDIKPVTICDVLADLGSYNGKMIVLLGRAAPSEEGKWIDGDCKKQLKTGSYVWRNCISLEYNTYSDTALGRKFEIDRDSLRDALKRVINTTKLHNGDCWAIVYGRFETHDKLEVVTAPDGYSLVPVGFGHLGFAPGQIVYRKNDIRLLSDKEVQDLLK